VSIKIVTTRSSGLTHLLADQTAPVRSTARTSRTLCSRTVEGYRGTQDYGKIGGRGFCVRCATQGEARGIVAPATPREAAEARAQVPTVDADPIFDPLKKHLREQLLRYIVGRTITCPRTGEVLDFRTCVVLNDADGDPHTVLSQRGWGEVVKFTPDAEYLLAKDSGLYLDHASLKGANVVAEPAGPRHPVSADQAELFEVVAEGTVQA